LIGRDGGGKEPPDGRGSRIEGYASIYGNKQGEMAEEGSHFIEVLAMMGPLATL